MSWETRLQELVETRTGIRLQVDVGHEHWRRFLEDRAHSAGLRSVEAWMELMESGSGSEAELLELVSLAAVPYTWFFRDQNQFDAIHTLLTEARGPRPLHLWSAGCSTGEEAWSLAILCADVGADAAILATDLRPDSIRQAREGRYSDWSLRETPSALRQRWFVRAAEGNRIAEELRPRVEFRVHNLARDPLPTPPGGFWDLIVCRNVVMYWSSEVAADVVRRMAQLLAPTGWLFVGVAESLRLLPTGLPNSRIGAALGYRAPGTALHSRPAPLIPVRMSTAEPRNEPPRATPSYPRAIAHLKTGELAAGRAMLETVVRVEPRHVLAWLTLGNLHLALHELDRALEAYVHAQVLSPLLPEVHYLLGLAYRKVGDHARAEESFRRALFLHPGFWPASYLLACTSERLGIGAVAAREYARTLRILELPASEPLFQSHLGELDALELPLGEVAKACRARIGHITFRSTEEMSHADDRRR